LGEGERLFFFFFLDGLALGLSDFFFGVELGLLLVEWLGDTLFDEVGLAVMLTEAVGLAVMLTEAVGEALGEGEGLGLAQK